MENAVKIGKWICKTKIATISSKIRHTNHHTILKTAKSIFVPGFSFWSHIQYRTDIALCASAPHTNSGFYIVKSAMRLINSGNLHIKKQYAVLVYAYSDFRYKKK